jgi:hypothetical protein
MKKNYLDNNYDVNFDTTGFAIFGVIAALIAFVFFASWLSFWICYLGGIITKIVIGKYIVAGASILGLNIAEDQIPLVAGTLGWIGGFFKSYNFSKNKN